MSNHLNETLAHLGLYERAFVAKTRSIKNAFMDKYFKGRSLNPATTGCGFFIEPYHSSARGHAQALGIYEQLTDSSDPLELSISYGVIYFFVENQDHLLSYSIDYRTESQQLVYSLSTKGFEKEMQIDYEVFSPIMLNTILEQYQQLLEQLLSPVK